MAEEFNNTVKEIFKLFRDIPNKGFKTKIHIKELQSKLVNGMNTDHEYAITFMAPLIWQAREEIARRDAEYFIKRRYEIDVQKLCNQHKFNYDNAINTIAYMKESFQTADDATKTKIMDNLVMLLQIVTKVELAKRGK